MERAGETCIHEDRAALIRILLIHHIRGRACSSGLGAAYARRTGQSQSPQEAFSRFTRGWVEVGGSEGCVKCASMFGTISSRCGPNRHDRGAMCLSSVFFFYERHLHVTKYHINSYSELNLNPSIRPLWNDSYLPTYVGKYLHGNIMLARYPRRLKSHQGVQAKVRLAGRQTSWLLIIWRNCMYKLIDYASSRGILTSKYAPNNIPRYLGMYQ